MEHQPPLSRSLYDIDSIAPQIEAGHTLLTPNFRLARRIRAEWNAQRIDAAEAAWETLDVQALESWLQARWQRAVAAAQLPPRLPLNQAQLAEVWQQVIAEEEQRSGTYQLLRPAAAADLASQARDTLLRWRIDLDDEGVRQAFTLDDDCAAFLRWRDLFEQRLEQAQQCTFTDCVRELLTIEREAAAPAVALVEFDDVPPLYREVLKHLCSELIEVGPGSGHTANCLAHAYTDRRGELLAVARWARNIQREQPQATVGVVLTDMAGDRVGLEYLMRREFDCLGDNYGALPVNFSTGLPLDRVPVVRDALAVLALGLRRVAVKDIVALLSSRFLALPDSESAASALFVRRLHDAGRAELDVADLIYSARDLALGDYLLAQSQQRELRSRASAAQWIERFSEILSLWGWPRGPLDSLEYQQVELWYRTLEAFKSYDAVSGPMDYETALQLLRSSCAAQVSQPKTADSAVQVLGPLEAAGLRFDHLWLVGMQGASWPAAPRPNPLIPQILQRQLQMPHATPEREWLFAEGLFSQYLRNAGEFHASYTQQLDGVPELPSSFLRDFPWAAQENPELLPQSWVQQWHERELQCLDDDRAPAVAAQELDDMSGGSGLLEDQSQCPFRAFAKRRLAVQPLSEFSVALSAADRGSLLHDALFALWGEIDDHAALHALDTAAELALVSGAVDSAVQAIPGARRAQLATAYWTLESERLRALLGEWLAVERQRSAFVVAGREQDISLQLQQLEIRLRVDRIDELPDGSRVIIDYKSGESKVAHWLGERPAKPQLLLYGIAEPESVAALSFARVRSRDCAFVGLGRSAVAPGIRSDIEKVVGEKMAADDWESLNARWRENLERLASEFLAGAAAVDPLANDSCTWCGLQPLCRVDMREKRS